jgi:hypothetical protein
MASKSCTPSIYPLRADSVYIDQQSAGGPETSFGITEGSRATVQTDRSHRGVPGPGIWCLGPGSVWRDGGRRTEAVRVDVFGRCFIPREDGSIRAVVRTSVAVWRRPRSA